MARRRGRPNQPQRNLIIEGLSTGMVTRSVDQFDDMTSEPIPIDPRSVPRAGDLAKLAQTRKARAETTQAEATLRTANALRSAMNQTGLLSTGMVDQATLKPKHNQVYTKSGLAITVGKSRGLRRL